MPYPGCGKIVDFPNLEEAKDFYTENERAMQLIVIEQKGAPYKVLHQKF